MQDILDLEDAMQTQRDKAILWFLASTAFRIGTLVELTWNDLEPTQDPEVPYQLVIESSWLKGKGKGRYRGLKQVAFLHSLGVEKLENYKKEIQRRGYRVNGDSPPFHSLQEKQGGSPTGNASCRSQVC